jgi:hypothetical protein
VAELFLKLAMCVELVEGAGALTLAVALDVGQIAAIRLLALAPISGFAPSVKKPGQLLTEINSLVSS